MMAPEPARRAAAVAAALLALSAGPAAAQALRTVEFSRQLRDTMPLEVRVDHAAGRVVVHAAERPLLYQAQLAYDPERSEPRYRYDADARCLRVGARRLAGDGGGRANPELRLDLSAAVPIALTVQMGAAQADLDLGGLRLTRLAVESGASDAELHFDAPNLVPMERLELDVGAASLRARGLANARAREMRVNVGIGAAELDFGGDWVGDIALDLQVALGAATLRVPEDVGVRVDARRFLAAFERRDFVRRDDAWYSTNWDTASRRLRVGGRMLLGKLELTRGAY